MNFDISLMELEEVKEYFTGNPEFAQIDLSEFDCLIQKGSRESRLFVKTYQVEEKMNHDQFRYMQADVVTYLTDSKYYKVLGKIKDLSLIPSPTLKTAVVEEFEMLLSDYEQDIESGIEEGIYEESENVFTRDRILRLKALIEQYKSYTPSVYAYIEGGVLQGASATEPVNLELFDRDNYDARESDEDWIGWNPEDWDKMIKEGTEKGELISIY